jgi:hypothetical protein
MPTFQFYKCSVILLLAASCKKEEGPSAQGFSASPTVKVIANAPTEISGLADSKLNPGMLWVHEDSGTPAQLTLVTHEGVVQKTIPIKGISNRDWEEMTLADASIYIGDIGDNNQSAAEYFIYQFAEPLSSVDTIRQVQTIRFRYSDGPHDAEAFWVDAVTKDIYLLTKRDVASRLYKIAYPYASGLNTANYIGSLNYNGVTGATITGDAKELIIKTYDKLYYYKEASMTTLIDALVNNRYTLLAYQAEPQGEAIGFAQNNTGFFTVSEKAFAADVRLFFYKRIP